MRYEYELLRSMTLTTPGLAASQWHTLAAVAGLASGSGPFKLQPLRLYSLLLIHCTRYPYARGLFGLKTRDSECAAAGDERAEAGGAAGCFGRARARDETWSERACIRVTMYVVNGTHSETCSTRESHISIPSATFSCASRHRRAHALDVSSFAATHIPCAQSAMLDRRIGHASQ